MVPAGSRRISRVPRYSGAALPCSSGFRVRGSHPLRPRSPARSAILRPRAAGGPTTPRGALPHPRFGLLRVRSPLLAQSLLFSLPAGTGMFRFPAFARLPLKPCRDRSRRVSPFGHPRVGGHLPLTAAFRSLSRPSSPPRATGIPHAPFSAFLFPFFPILSSMDGTGLRGKRLSPNICFNCSLDSRLISLLSVLVVNLSLLLPPDFFLRRACPTCQ